MGNMEINIDRLLGTPFFKDSVVLAGKKGLNRTINSATVIDTPDAVKWLKGNELVLTTAYSFKEDLEAQKSIVQNLARGNAGALAIKLRYLRNISNELRNWADELSFPIISIEEKYSWLEIINYVRALKDNKRAQELGGVKRFYPGFLEACLGEEPFQQIVNELYLKMGYPSLFFNVLTKEYCSAPKGLLLSEQSLVYEPVEFNNNRLANYPVVMYRWNDCERSGTAIKIFIDGTPVASIMLLANEKDFYWHDWTCIESAVVSTILELKHRDNLNNLHMQYKNYFLDQILYSNEVYQDLTKWVSNIGWEPQDLMAVMVMDGDFEPHTLGRFSSNKYEKRFFIGYDRNSQLTMILTFDHKRDYEEFINELQEVINCGGADYIAGIGSIVHDIPGIRQSHKEATYARNIAKQMGFRKKIISYADLGIYMLLDSACLGKEMDSFYENYLLPIIEYDEKYNTELVKTLVVFIDSGNNYRETASKLFLHHNTVRYRINRIEKLCKVDLNSPTDRLNLSVALKILPLKLNFREANINVLGVGF